METRHTPRTSPDQELTGYPPGIPYIIWNEGCERFSFYGMRAILYVYVLSLYINLRGMAEPAAKLAATETVHLFNAGVYALPLVGAIISDRLLGKYRTIISLSIVYCLGHLALAVFEDPTWQADLLGRVVIDPIHGLYIGLGLIAVGSGGIKPCVSANVGDQFGKGNWHLLQRIYNAFYFIINFGSAFATIFIPLILGKEVVDPVTGQHHFTGHAGWAFGVPGILMGLATIAFWMGRKRFVQVPPAQPFRLGLLDSVSGTALFLVIGYPIFFHELTPGWGTVAVAAACLVFALAVFAVRQRIQEDDGFLAQTLFALRAKLARTDLGPGAPPVEGRRDLRDHFLYGPAARHWSSEVAEGPVAVWKIVTVFLMISVFWALFDQHSSTWIEQAKAMDRLVLLDLQGWLATGATLGLLVGLAVVLTLKRSLAKRALGLAFGIAVGMAVALLAHSYQPEVGYDIQPSQVPSINPFLVMILIPYTSYGLYPLMRKVGIEPHPLLRMSMGMLIAALAFVAVALLQARIDVAAAAGAKVHVAWQVIPYIVITIAEVMVSITGLEFAYSQAPRKMKSVIMGFWLFNVTLGNLLVAFLAGFEGMELESFFWVFAALMAAAGLLFSLRAKLYKYQDYTQ